MNIQIICIGKLKEKYWTDAVGEYMKRMSGYASVKIVELKEARLPDKAGPAEEEKVKLEEGREILKSIKDGTYVVTLEIQGKQLSSEAPRRRTPKDSGGAGAETPTAPSP